jgi:hypothetical protein
MQVYPPAGARRRGQRPSWPPVGWSPAVPASRYPQIGDAAGFTAESPPAGNATLILKGTGGG